MYSAIKNTFVLTAIFVISITTFATPITFNSAGSVSEYIISNGQWEKPYVAIPRWNEKGVNGSLTMELDKAIPKHQHAQQIPKSSIQDMSLRLISSGEKAHQRLNYLDFDRVEFNPAFAVNDNYPYLKHLKDNGGKLEYTFKIDSLTRVSEVDEPNALWLVALGFAGLLINRARRTKNGM